MAVAHDIHENNRIIEWAHAFRMCRHEARKDYHAVADYCGVARGLVRAWEDGIAIPNHAALRRLHGLLPRLEFYKDLLPRPKPITNAPTENVELLKAPLFSIAQHKQFADKPPPKVPQLPPPPTSRELTVTKKQEMVTVPVTKLNFGEALKFLREKNGFSVQEIARLMDVTSGTIYTWEKNDNYPVIGHYNKLIELFPDLKYASRPDVKNWNKPDSSGVPRDYSYQQPEPVKPHKPDIAQLGSVYAEALKKMSVVQTKVDELTAALIIADDELKKVKEEAEQAHEALKKATGAT